MFKKYLALILTILVINLSFNSFVSAETITGKRAEFAEKVKANVAKLGVGSESKVKVKLQNGTKLKGYVSKISNESFTVTDEKTGMITELPYSKVKQIKGNNLHTGIKIAIGVAILIVFLWWLDYELGKS